MDCISTMTMLNSHNMRGISHLDFSVSIRTAQVPSLRCLVITDDSHTVFHLVLFLGVDMTGTENDYIGIVRPGFSKMILDTLFGNNNIFLTTERASPNIGVILHKE